MEYQPVSNLAQLQALEGLLRIVLHGVLLTMAAALVLLLGLCLSELRPPRRRPSEIAGLQGRRSGEPLPEARRAASLYRLTPIRLWAGDAEGAYGGPVPGAAGPSGGGSAAKSAPALRVGQREHDHGWRKPAKSH